MARAKRESRKLSPVHPGEILREDYMKPLRLSMNQLALDLRVPATRIAEIVHERPRNFRGYRNPPRKILHDDSSLLAKSSNHLRFGSR
jgi:hypothetical protein